MFEVYYRAPEDVEREASILAQVSTGGGQQDFRETPVSRNGAVVLTYTFSILEQAENVAQRLRRLGEYVEGPSDYGG